jgi:arabinose-5-phosphate isomerase
MIIANKNIEIGKQVVLSEIKELLDLEHTIGDEFNKAVEIISKCVGKVIVTGIGKSGHIARKIAATMSSTGTPAAFLHPAEACHGDMGMVTKDDVLVNISYSGEASEIVTLIPAIKKLGLKIISISGNSESTLAKVGDVYLSIKVNEEACPLNLAPTSSTTKTLVLGDALSIALLKTKEFKKDDFAMSHPSGLLGKRLLTTVSDLMHTDDEIPMTNSESTIATAIKVMSMKGLGITAVYGKDYKDIVGVFTDGDLRRAIENKADIHSEKINKSMTVSYKVIDKNQLAISALEIMKKFKISSLFVLDGHKKIAGIIHIHDIISAGINYNDAV